MVTINKSGYFHHLLPEYSVGQMLNCKPHNRWQLLLLEVFGQRSATCHQSLDKQDQRPVDPVP